jgi:hypothetical protein
MIASLCTLCHLRLYALGMVLTSHGSQGPHGTAALQFKVPLLGDLRSLQLSARPVLFRIQDGIEHTPICPCHKLPGLRGAHMQH